MKEHLKDYRKHIVELRQASIAQYEKTLLTLSTGALALSVVFVKDIFNGEVSEVINYLYLAWLCWTVSISISLVSFYVSQLAYDKALQQIDTDVIYTETPGGVYTGIIFKLNTVNGLIFLLGIVFMALVGVFRT